jgi:acyl carrier protein
MQDKVLAKIIERASSIWGVDSATLNSETAFVNMGAKSVHYSQMTTFLEDAFDIEVPYMNFKRCKTLGEAAQYVANLMEE